MRKGKERMKMRDTGVERERMSREERGWKGEVREGRKDEGEGSERENEDERHRRELREKK